MSGDKNIAKMHDVFKNEKCILSNGKMGGGGPTGNNHIMNNYPLYDVPYLVREPNGSYMSRARHRIEAQNQAIVDAYFLERDKGTPAPRSKKIVAQKKGIPIERVWHSLRWYYQEAERRKRYDFLIKFPPAKEHIVHY